MLSQVPHHQDAKGHASLCKHQAGTACHVLVPALCPWDRAGFPGLDVLWMPKRESRTKGDVVPCASPGLPEFTAPLFPETFLQEEVTIVLLDIQKNSGNTRRGERESAQQWHGHRGMQGMRRPGCPGPMNLTSWTMTFCVLPTAEGFWRAKSSSLLWGDNSSSGVIKTGPDHKSEWIKPLGKERDKRYEKLYISKDAGQKSPEGMGVLGDIYFCLPRCHCCRGGLLTSVSMLTPTPGESNGSWLDGYQFAKKRIPWEFHCHFMGHHFWSEKELRQWLSPCLCHHHYQLFSTVPWRMRNFEITGP